MILDTSISIKPSLSMSPAVGPTDQQGECGEPVSDLHFSLEQFYSLVNVF